MAYRALNRASPLVSYLRRARCRRDESGRLCIPALIAHERRTRQYTAGFFVFLFVLRDTGCLASTAAEGAEARCCLPAIEEECYAGNPKRPMNPGLAPKRAVVTRADG